MAEYIEREALYEKAYWHGEHPDVGNPFPDGVDAIDIKDVDAIPSADVAPVVHGQWISLTKCSNAGVYCSICHKKVYKEDYAWCNRKNKLRSSYCPNCGAKMDGGAD